MSVAFNRYRNRAGSASVPVGYLTMYNRKTGIEVFEEAYRGFLKLLNQLLGYSLKEEGFSLSLKTQEKALRKAKQRYAQGGLESLLSYLKGWRTWGQAGLPFQIQNLDTAVLQVKEAAISPSHSRAPRNSEHGGRRRKDIPPSPNQPWTLLSSVNDGRLYNPKGELKCKTNFFKHYY